MVIIKERQKKKKEKKYKKKKKDRTKMWPNFWLVIVDIELLTW